MEGVENRSAHFETAVAFAREDGIRVFRGILPGTIVEPRGAGGFGYDPIFALRRKDTCRDAARREEQDLTPGACA